MTQSLFATYEYDAWGKLISVKDASGNTITSDSNFAILNSIRYRGYYYDTESGLYYLQSRYYDPTTGRFVNADDVYYMGNNGNLLDFNLFMYCCNNPTNHSDNNGHASYKSWYKPMGSMYIIYTEIRFWWTKITVKYLICNNFIKFPFDNGNDYFGILCRGGATVLAEAIYKIAKHINKNLLSGRTIGGIDVELRLHYIAYALGIEYRRAHIADIGGMYKRMIGYDDDAWWFESSNPVKIVQRMNLCPLWGLSSTISSIVGYL